jgi:hypothetical protein
MKLGWGELQLAFELGVPLGFCVYQLWSVRRDQRRSQEAAAAKKASVPPAGGDPETAAVRATTSPSD